MSLISIIVKEAVYIDIVYIVSEKITSYCTHVSLGSASLLYGMGCDIATGHQVAEVDPPHGHHVTERFPHLICIP